MADADCNGGCNDVLPSGNSRSSGHGERGRFVAGNTAAMTHGLRRYELRGALTADVRAVVDRFHAQVIADRGGVDQLTAIEGGYCRRLAQLEGALELLGRDLNQRGVMTARGRPRAAYRAFLDTLAAWDRIAQRVGVARRAKQVEPDALDIVRQYDRSEAPR